MRINSFAKSLLHTSAIVAVSVSAAYAQDATVEEIQEDADTVVVTGSRIKSNTFTSPVSIDVLNVDDARLEGIADIGGLLQTATAASGSNQVTAAVSNAFVVNGGLGAESVDLRGVGANRTLSLINGRRAGPSGVRGSVSSFDLNSIPLAGIERVDILKDGASSVYGSDAIAGVVNYITRKGDGAEIDAFTEIGEQSGGETYRLSGTYGKTFDRGHVRFTADYLKQEELQRKDREYLDCNQDYSFVPGTTTRNDQIDPRTGEPVCSGTIWGQIWLYGPRGEGTNVPNNPRNRLLQFDYDNNLANFIPELPSCAGCIQVPTGWFPVEYDQSHITNPDGSTQSAYAGVDISDNGPNRVTNLYNDFQRDNYVTPDVERYTLMFDGEYELTDNITAYGEALFNRRTNTVENIRQYYSFIYGQDSFGVNNTNPIAQGWLGPAVYSPTPIAPGFVSTTEIDYFRLVGGLKGDFGDAGPLPGWSWDIYGQHSDSHGEYTTTEIYDDSITPYDLQTSSCNDIDFGNGLGMTAGATSDTFGITLAGRPCVDIPWFDPEFERGVLTQEQRDFLFTEATGTTDFTSTTIEGFATGDVVNLPAGKLSAAIGIFYNRDEITDKPSDLVLAGNAWQSDFAGITTGVQKTTAIYGELKAPLVRDQPFFESLDLAVSGRYSEITSENEDGRSLGVDGFNYRASLDWQITPLLRARGTIGTSFRAPGLFEQFLADESSFIRQSSIDPCIGWGTALADGVITQTTATNCAADGIPLDYAGNPISASVLQGGGFGSLIPETSDNFTVGMIITPDFADLSIAVDYFDIVVEDEISTLTSNGIVSGCYASEDFANEPLCSGFDREGPGSITPLLITEVRATFINVNRQENSGIDLTVRYGQDTGIGRFDLNTQWTYQLESKSLLLAESLVQDTNGEIGEPKLTGFANINYDPGGNWGLLWSMDYVGATSNRKRANRVNPNPTIDSVPVELKNNTEITIYHGLSGIYEMDGGWTFRAGINNLFDERPPATSNFTGQVGNSVIRSQYDLLGRSGFVNITKTFG